MEILLITFSAENIYLEYSAYSLYCLKSYISKDPSFEKVNISIKYYNCHVSSDSEAEQGKEITDFIKDKEVQLIGFGCYIWNIRRILPLAYEIKKLFPNIKIVLGGPQVMYKPDELLHKNPYIDVIVRGDGEETFSELIRAYLYCDRNINEISGLVFRANDEIISTPQRQALTELDSIPSPYLTGLYNNIRKGYVYPIETSRGCVFKCSYCHWGLSKLRFFSLERIKKEIDYLLANKISLCMFVDSAVNFDKNRALEIIDFINKNNKGTIVTMFQSIHYLDEELINILNASPGIYTEIGIQSLNPVALRNINRRIITREEFSRLSLMKRAFTIDLIYGLPGDNLQLFKKTFEEVFLCTRNISMFRLGVHPGTDLWEKIEDYKIVLDEKDYSVISNYSYSKKEIEETERFKKNYEELFTTVICSEFSQQEIASIADSLKLSIFDLINRYSLYLKKNFSSEYINTIKHAERDVKLQSLREISTIEGGGIF